MVNSSTRTWTDANGDYIPQESELGLHSAADFWTAAADDGVFG